MKLNWGALAAKIAGGALAGFAPLLGTLFPQQQILWTTIFGTGGLLVLIAGMVVQSLQPTTKTVEDPQVVGGDGKPTGATLVSTTSELLPVNQPVKGA